MPGIKQHKDKQYIPSTQENLRRKHLKIKLYLKCNNCTKSSKTYPDTAQILFFKPPVTTEATTEVTTEATLVNFQMQTGKNTNLLRHLLRQSNWVAMLRNKQFLRLVKTAVPARNMVSCQKQHALHCLQKAWPGFEGALCN